MQQWPTLARMTDMEHDSDSESSWTVCKSRQKVVIVDVEIMN